MDMRQDSDYGDMGMSLNEDLVELDHKLGTIAALEYFEKWVSLDWSGSSLRVVYSCNETRVD